MRDEPGKLPFKPVVWVGSSLKDLREFPGAIQDYMGYALFVRSKEANIEAGRETPGGHIELIKQRLREAERIAKGPSHEQERP